ncbi:MAG: 3-dehydro-L-gulonate 2-dehydrogenase [Treponema sp.]|nr:3-dehydro-L-gulonate 2-dehydrogenase [Treponema sp.]MDD7450311.1 3-dehydro-L-gulonate 2-dehydrogenase [Treponema sp.]MDY2923964.1 3-dehydro-L-gulonate 2-dehydrogenase [Treponema sp.]MDY5683784.1 3-dehydro-L-gulonate 2-dehydrogenase [Treponema sp.]
MSKRIPFEILKKTIKQALLNAGLSEHQAEICSQIHSESSADGVESHGLNRIPRFVEYINKGWINLKGSPKFLGGKGAVENYDGELGIGITNALFCSERAVELAKIHGIGCVALKNTTHWMRGGTYTWRMAEKGFVGFAWINTENCMPLWGSDEPSVGNNPFCIGLPRKKGIVVLDMAMSQYAYGKLGVYRLAGKQLPYPGGFDKNGNLTTDPGAIEQTMRALPAGYWKGSGLALALDMAAAVMANGKCGSDMNAKTGGSCGGCCQVFIAYDPCLFGEEEEIQNIMDRRIDAVHSSHPEKEGGHVTFPGERTVATRQKSMSEGVIVDETVWAQVEAIAAGDTNAKDIASC